MGSQRQAGSLIALTAEARVSPSEASTTTHRQPSQQESAPKRSLQFRKSPRPLSCDHNQHPFNDPQPPDRRTAVTTRPLAHPYAAVLPSQHSLGRGDLGCAMRLRGHAPQAVRRYQAAWPVPPSTSSRQTAPHLAEDAGAISGPPAKASQAARDQEQARLSTLTLTAKDRSRAAPSPPNGPSRPHKHRISNRRASRATAPPDRRSVHNAPATPIGTPHLP